MYLHLFVCMSWTKIPFLLNFPILKLCIALNLLLLLGGDWEGAGPGQSRPGGVGRRAHCLYLSSRSQLSQPGEYDIPPGWERVKILD